MSNFFLGSPQAEKVFRANLKKYPYNWRSLFSLQASLQAQGKDAAQVVQVEFATAWKDADTLLDIAKM